MNMKIKEGFTLHELGDECIVIHDGRTNVNFDKLLSLNATAAYLWKEVEGKDFDAESLSKLLLEHYDVEEEVARRDAEALLAKWIESGVVS